MKLPLFQVDAFTRRLFGGNPAAVVILERWLPDEVLAAIASENNLAETAYVILTPDAAGGFPLRWFTPAVEVDLCGHATLASAHVIFRHYQPDARQVAFSTRSGRLAVTRDGDRLTLDLPVRPATPVPVTDALAAALGVRPGEVLLSRDLLAILASEAEVRAVRPDFRLLDALEPEGFIVSAPGDKVDFVSRYFAPKVGIPEDPVTGSAHCTLTPYWAGRLGRQTLTARQLSARGGDLTCTLSGERVLVAGEAVEYLRGEIEFS